MKFKEQKANDHSMNVLQIMHIDFIIIILFFLSGIYYSVKFEE